MKRTALFFLLSPVLSPLALWLSLAGCNGDPAMMMAPAGPQKLADAATVAALSQDQKFLAFYSNTGLLSNGAPSGTLSVLPLGAGDASAGSPIKPIKPIKIDEGAFDASFGRTGDVLFYSTGAAASTDMNSRAIDGTLHLWTPMLSLPGRITTGLATRQAAPPDHSFVLVADSPMPSLSAPATVTLVRAADCTANGCKGITLDTGATVTAMTASLDGRYAAYVKKVGMGFMAKQETWLVSVADGKATRVASSGLLSMGAPPVAFSPDGTLLATIVDKGMGFLAAPQQLQMLETATGMAVPWAAMPANTGVTMMAFSDAKTLLAELATLQGDQGLFVMTADMATRLSPPVRAFYVEQFPPGANRYLFVSTTANNDGSFNLQVYDLHAMAPSPLPVAMATGAPPIFSADLTQAAFLEAYNPKTQTGTLTVLSLTAGLPGQAPLKTVAAGVASGMFGFAGTSNKLLWVDKPDAMGAGTLMESNAAMATVVEKGVFNYRVRAADVAYVSVSEPDPAQVPVRTAGIYKEMLP